MKYIKSHTQLSGKNMHCNTTTIEKAVKEVGGKCMHCKMWVCCKYVAHNPTALHRCSIKKPLDVYSSEISNNLELAFTVDT